MFFLQFEEIGLVKRIKGSRVWKIIIQSLSDLTSLVRWREPWFKLK
jgi:hypothetical protein